jgi:hypothetical protein
MSSEVEFLVKLRDAAAMILDGCESRLESLAPAGVRQASATAQKKDYDIEKIQWQDAKGDKGPFQKSADVNSLDHKQLLKDVQAHKGKMTVQGWFVWVFQDGSTLGRKKRSF